MTHGGRLEHFLKVMGCPSVSSLNILFKLIMTSRNANTVNIILSDNVVKSFLNLDHAAESVEHAADKRRKNQIHVLHPEALRIIVKHHHEFL